MHRPCEIASALRSALFAWVLALAVVGCVGPAAPPALDDARAAVERARSAPRVRALAAAELDLAEIALEQATAAARAGWPRAEVEHLAYVASQRAAFAEARAAAQVARSETRLLRRALGQAAIEARWEEQRPRPQGNRGPYALPAEARPQTAAAADQGAPPAESDSGSVAADQVLPAGESDSGRMAADQGMPVAEPDAVAVEMEALPGHLTLALSELPFEQAAPTEAALVELAGMAERMLREPWRILLIEAAFDLPEPAARTLMERRVEVVRAFFLERGVAPARLVVQATTDGRPRPPVASFAVPTE